MTVKMRLGGWDDDHVSAPDLAATFEDLGVAAVTVHGRTRQQGFRGSVNRAAIRDVVSATTAMPVIANGDVRTVDDAISMIEETGCAAVAIGRGAMLDPWIFRKLQQHSCGQEPTDPTADEQVSFLAEHFRLMTEQHGEYSCVLFRKFAAWYGAALGIPESLEDELRRIASFSHFNSIVQQIRLRHGERSTWIPTAMIKVPNGPVERW
ncbi:MAG: tRNA-dihydrouridine synthase [Planctomycetaceae bacterium]